MLLTENIDELNTAVSGKQLRVIKDFLSAPLDWNNIQHGDKQKLTEDISVVFIKTAGTDQYKNVLEAHRNFHDLHFTAEGNDIIVSKPVKDCTDIKTEYNDEGDYILFNEEPVDSLTIPANTFCLISPADAHMALYENCGAVKKLVFKIPVQA